jgi:16S rRNA (cytosine967-C5)-methyltransferase
VSAAANPRARAAQALADIVAGQSLRTALAARSSGIADSRDRALLAALVQAGARWWLRYDPALDELLEQPLRRREPVVHALLVVGLVQLEVLRLPEYAAVAATVDAARALRKPKFANLVNAVLRRWLRERDPRCAALDRDPATRDAHPGWLLRLLAADWPQQAQAIIAANNAEAPLWLRVNRRRAQRDVLAALLNDSGVASATAAALPDALVLDQSTDVTRLPGYADGAFSVQDGAAQFAAHLLDLRHGQRVLDACAAPGGKSAHILETAEVDVLALDRDAARLPRLHENLTRLGLRADVRVGDAGEPESWWDGRAFDRILLDAPCSATGIIRRQPDIKLHRRAADVDALVRTQARLLEALWPLLRPAGRLVYATCSTLAGENARQIEAFLRRHADAKPVPPQLGWHSAGSGEQNLPGEGRMDGFFYAIVEKHN